MSDMPSIEWDKKAFELLHDLQEEDPVMEDLQKYLIRNLGPRPFTGVRKIEQLPGTIEMMEKLYARRGWHRLKVKSETVPTLVALGHAELRSRPNSGWYDLKLTAKGRKFLRDYRKEKENKDEN